MTRLSKMSFSKVSAGALARIMPTTRRTKIMTMHLCGAFAFPAQLLQRQARQLCRPHKVQLHRLQAAQRCRLALLRYQPAITRRECRPPRRFQVLRQPRAPFHRLPPHLSRLPRAFPQHRRRCRRRCRQRVGTRLTHQQTLHPRAQHHCPPHRRPMSQPLPRWSQRFSPLRRRPCSASRAARARCSPTDLRKTFARRKTCRSARAPNWSARSASSTTISGSIWSHSGIWLTRTSSHASR
mmetsp:Transcript_6454/g.18014  ORF Transcript_6454/g.18014 Transcript_6454/m.18014 type:complete len:239 (+) Transcript_6454:830-1546(+)